MLHRMMVCAWLSAIAGAVGLMAACHKEGIPVSRHCLATLLPLHMDLSSRVRTNQAAPLQSMVYVPRPGESGAICPVTGSNYLFMAIMMDDSSRVMWPAGEEIMVVNADSAAHPGGARNIIMGGKWLRCMEPDFQDVWREIGEGHLPRSIWGKKAGAYVSGHDFQRPE